jgi:hypothetical protein
LLNAEIAIVGFRLSFADQGNKVPFSVSVCSKQTEVFRFRFPFSANEIGFFVYVSVFYIYISLLPCKRKLSDCLQTD